MALYREYRPDRRLAPFVECGWLRSGSATGLIRVLPDGCVDVYVTSRGNVMVAGPATSSYDLSADDGCVLAGFRFRPGAAAVVMGQSVHEFKDHRVAVDSVFGAAGRRMAETLLATTNPTQRVIVLESMLVRHFGKVEPVLDHPVARAVEMLRARPGWPVSSLAAGVGLSERQLRRRFDAAVGYGPKRLGRIFRFQRLLDLLHAPHWRVGWAELAAAAGYVDQSHMINECQTLAGVPPTALPGAASTVGSFNGMSVSSNTARAGLP
jgi:AraC-like DNA-binding protein